MNNKNNKLIKISEVIYQTSLSRSTIYRLINQGLFPEQVKLSTRSSAWVESEIDDWIKERSNLRRFGGIHYYGDNKWYLQKKKRKF